VIVSATAATMALPANSIKAISSTDLQLNIWDKEAHVGWTTVHVRRNDVPAQSASIALPLRSVAMD
jgi:hypothetical protein